MKPHTIVVTGASGFTGPFVVRSLATRFPEATIRCLVRATSRVDHLRRDRVEFVLGDLRDVASLRAAFSDADALVNVASLGFDWIDPLFEAVSGSALKRGVFISTTAILTKLPVRSRATRERGESLVRTSGLAWTIVRPTMIFGTPGDRNIARLIRFVHRSPIIPVVAPGALQQPVHVEDVAAAVTAALASPAAVNQAYNIAGRTPMTLEEIVRTVVRLAGLRRLMVRMPVAPVRAAVAVMSRLSSKPPITVEQVDRLHEDKAFDYRDAARDLAYAPQSFEEGVLAELALMRANPRQSWSERV